MCSRQSGVLPSRHSRSAATPRVAKAAHVRSRLAVLAELAGLEQELGLGQGAQDARPQVHGAVLDLGQVVERAEPDRAVRVRFPAAVRQVLAAVVAHPDPGSCFLVLFFFIADLILRLIR